MKIEDPKATAPEPLSEIDESSISQPSISWLAAGRSMFLARGADAGVRFLLFLAAARVLSPADFSRYALLTAALATCQWTLSLGAPRVALYFQARGKRGPLFAWLYLLALGAAAVALGAVAAAAPLRRIFFPAIPSAWILLGLSPLPFSLLSDSLASALFAQGKTRAYAATLWMRNLATAAVLGTSLAAPDRLVWILAGRLLVQAAVALVTAIAARARPRVDGLAEFAPEAIAYGIPTALSDGIVALHRRADVFLLSAFGRGIEIGSYALAFALAEAFWLVTDSLEAALFVHIARTPEADARQSARRALRLSLVLAAAGFPLGLLAARGLLRLFLSTRYPDAAALLPWTLAAAVAWGLSRPFASFLAARGRVLALLGCHAAGLAANLAINAFAIPALGARGAALASVASYALDTVLLWAAFGRAGASPVESRR